MVITNPTAAILDEVKGIVRYTVSTRTIDGEGDIVMTSGIGLTNYRKNPTFLDAHNRDSITSVIGKAITIDRDSDGRLIADIQYALDTKTDGTPINPRAVFGFDMVKAGYLPAVSIGFHNARGMKRTGKNAKAFARFARQHGIEPTDDIRRIVLTCDLHEISAVPVGANPDALLASVKSGQLTTDHLSERHQEHFKALSDLAESTTFSAADRKTLAHAAAHILSTGDPYVSPPTPQRSSGPPRSESSRRAERLLQRMRELRAGS